MMRGCPSANAAHARPRGVRDSEGERPVNQKYQLLRID